MYHIGGQVSWLHSYASLRGPNVLGTKTTLKLAAIRGSGNNTVRYIYLSSISVSNSCWMMSDEYTLNNEDDDNDDLTRRRCNDEEEKEDTGSTARSNEKQPSGIALNSRLVDMLANIDGYTCSKVK